MFPVFRGREQAETFLPRVDEKREIYKITKRSEQLISVSDDDESDSVLHKILIRIDIFFFFF